MLPASMYIVDLGPAQYGCNPLNNALLSRCVKTKKNFDLCSQGKLVYEL